jgi:hypothetical protein
VLPGGAGHEPIQVLASTSLPLPSSSGWPVARQLTGADRLGLGAAAKSRRTSELRPRTATAGKVVKSVCPYCAAACAPRDRRACS